MKKITLYAASSRNNGDYVDAGETLTIGNGAEEITSERAKTLVDGNLAASETAAKAEGAGKELPGSDANA